MQPRDIIWTTAMLGFVLTIGLLFNRGMIDFQNPSMSSGEWLILVLSVLMVGVFVRRFVNDNFDQNGDWIGRILRRRRDGKGQ